MTRRTIPACTETFCDRCGVQHTLSNSYKQGRLIMNYNPSCEPLEWDLCDECVAVMYTSVQQVLHAINQPLAQDFMKGSLR